MPVPRLPAEWTRLRAYDSLEARPWANGLGATTELLSFEESRAITAPTRGRWRLSVARLDAPAAFSRLPGLRRILVPVGGAVVLAVDGREHRIDPGFTFHFSGDAETELVSLPEPCFALNFMTYDTKLAISREVPAAGSALALVPLDDGPDAGGGGGGGTRVSRFDLLVPRDGANGLPGAAAPVPILSTALPHPIAVVQWP